MDSIIFWEASYEKEKKNQSTGSATVTENTEADVRESAGNTETQNDTKEPGDAEEKNDATV